MRCGKQHGDMVDYHSTVKIAVKPTVTYDEQYVMPEFHTSLYLCSACNHKANDNARVDSLNMLKSRWMRTIGIILIVTILSISIIYVVATNQLPTETNPLFEDTLYLLIGLLIVGGFIACCRGSAGSVLDPTSQFFRVFYYPFMFIVKNEEFARIFSESNPDIEVQVQPNMDELPYHYSEDKGILPAAESETEDNDSI